MNATLQIHSFFSEISLWTGIKKGPPARLRFPDPDVVLYTLNKALDSK